MEKEELEKLHKVIENNNKWPLILEGVSSDMFPTAIIIPSNIPSEELGVVGDKFPLWTMELRIRGKGNTRPLLIIDNIDEIDKDDQEKFVGILKYHKTNGFNFPQDTQIILTASDVSKISRRITSVCIIYKAE